MNIEQYGAFRFPLECYSGDVGRGRQLCVFRRRMATGERGDAFTVAPTLLSVQVFLIAKKPRTDKSVGATGFYLGGNPGLGNSTTPIWPSLSISMVGA